MKMQKLLLLAVTCLLYGLAVGDISLTTTGSNKDSTGVFITGPHHLVFEAKASRDALIGLATSDSDETLQWEVAIGGGNNQRDILRSLTGTCDDQTENSCSRVSLDPDEFRAFWISWEETSIKLGTGTAVGENELCSHEGSFKLTDLYVRLGSYGAQNTVDWIVHGYMDVSCCQSFTARSNPFAPYNVMNTPVDLSDITSFTFKLKASGSAQMYIGKDDANLDSFSGQFYKIVVSSNSVSIYKGCKVCIFGGETGTSSGLLDPLAYVDLWISWQMSFGWGSTSRYIKVGRGTVVGQNRIVQYRETSNFHAINKIGLKGFGSDWLICDTDDTCNEDEHILPNRVTMTTGDSFPCDGSSCHSNAYCKQTRDGDSVCKCHLGYTGNGQNCEAVPAGGITPDQQGHIQTGLDAASLVADLVANDDSEKFSTGLRNFASTASRFAPAVSLVFGLVFTIIPVGDNALTLEMRESFLEVNRKLDQIQDSIEDLSDKVDWNEYKTELRGYMNTIKSCAEKLDELARLSPGDPGFDSKKRDVIDEYRENLGLGRRFKNFLTGNFLDENIFSAFARFVDNDRKQVHTLMRLTLQSLMNASKIEMANIPLRDDSPEEIQGRIDHETENWCGYFEAVQNKMVEVDEAVRDAWHTQAKDHDIPDFARDNRELQHSDFADQLLDRLARKYYWRRWFVASYGEITGYRYHSFTRNNDKIFPFLRQNGRNLAVASVPKEDTYDHTAALGALNEYKSTRDYRDCCRCCGSGSWFCNCWGSCCEAGGCEIEGYEWAQLVASELPMYGALRMVVQMCNDLSVASNGDNAVVRVDDIHRCDDMLGFGDDSCKHYIALYFG